MNFAKLCGAKKSIYRSIYYIGYLNKIFLYSSLPIFLLNSLYACSLGVQTGSKIQNNTEQLHPTDAIDHSAQTCCFFYFVAHIFI